MRERHLGDGAELLVGEAVVEGELARFDCAGDVPEAGVLTPSGLVMK